MAWMHPARSAADAAFAVSLAGSLSFSVPLGAAWPRIAAYLALTMAPFAVVAPHAQPGGRRVPGRASSRAAGHQRRRRPELAVPDPGPQHLLVLSGGVRRARAGPGVRHRGAAALSLYVLAAALASRLPAAARSEAWPSPLDPEPAAAQSMLAPLPSMGLLRAATGFLTFLAAFALRRNGEPAWVYGAVRWHPGPAASSARRRRGSGRGVGRQGFGAHVQSVTAEAARTQAFARAETWLHLMWMGGALAAVLLRPPTSTGPTALAVTLGGGMLAAVWAVRRFPPCAAERARTGEETQAAALLWSRLTTDADPAAAHDALAWSGIATSALSPPAAPGTPVDDTPPRAQVGARTRRQPPGWKGLRRRLPVACSPAGRAGPCSSTVTV
ncbi:MAG: hypothetical protein ACKVWR_01410 [Acidimicrobiales bacterium]